MEKYVKDGKVAVLVSPGWGAGWSTWANERSKDQLAMDSRFVKAKLDGLDEGELEELVKCVFGEDAYVYFGGWSNVEVEWVPVGEIFEITEYDGHEELKFIDSLSMTA